mmetsp:Transcript_38522/g.151919  ORF Transcript_38522/g.151919 Transcript_38522/m.151919 type:complete len:85 (-) Transcript_38522:303-557(-)
MSPAQTEEPRRWQAPPNARSSHAFAPTSQFMMLFDKFFSWSFTNKALEMSACCTYCLNEHGDGNPTALILTSQGVPMDYVQLCD